MTEIPEELQVLAERWPAEYHDDTKHWTVGGVPVAFSLEEARRIHSPVYGLQPISYAQALVFYIKWWGLYVLREEMTLTNCKHWWPTELLYHPEGGGSFCTEGCALDKVTEDQGTTRGPWKEII